MEDAPVKKRVYEAVDKGEQVWCVSVKNTRELGLDMEFSKEGDGLTLTLIREGLVADYNKRQTNLEEKINVGDKIVRVNAVEGECLGGKFDINHAELVSKPYTLTIARKMTGVAVRVRDIVKIVGPNHRGDDSFLGMTGTITEGARQSIKGEYGVKFNGAFTTNRFPAASLDLDYRVFDAHIINTQPLGMDLEHVGSQLRIKGIKEGLVHQFNQHHPDEKLKLGDKIVKVNDVEGIRLMEDRLSTAAHGYPVTLSIARDMVSAITKMVKAEPSLMKDQFVIGEEPALVNFFELKAERPPIDKKDKRNQPVASDFQFLQKVKNGIKDEFGAFGKDMERLLNIPGSERDRAPQAPDFSGPSPIDCFQSQLRFPQDEDILARRKMGTLLHIAALRGHMDIVCALIDANAEVNAVNQQKESALHLAAEDDRANITFVLVEARADLVAKDAQNQTPLHRAAFAGASEATRVLLNANASLTAQDDDGLGPLHKAVYAGHDIVVDQLIQGGASVAAVTESRATALHIAASRGSYELCQLLLASGANKNDLDIDGCTALHAAAARGVVRVVQFLAEANCDIHEKDQSLWTPLHHAAEYGNVAAARYLLERQAQVSFNNRRQQTPLHLATDEGHLEMCALLIQFGAEHNKLSIAYGQPTPKMIADRTGQQRIQTLFEMTDLLDARGR